MVDFIARAVAASELVDLNVRIVVLAEREHGEGARLEISRALEFTDQDAELDQDTYCLSTQTGATVYGGVTRAALEGPTLHMQLDQRASDALGVPRSFSILLDTDTATIEGVRGALEKILVELKL